MRKHIALMLLAVPVLLAALLASGCGSGGGQSDDSAADSAPARAAPDTAEYGGAGVAAAPINLERAGALSEKIIYYVEATIETTEFDDALSKVYGMLDAHGAFIETSDVRGNGYSGSYFGGGAMRTARFQIRVPKERLTSVTDWLPALGAVTALSSEAENITAQYTDSESRLAAFRMEEARLLEMLEESGTLADLLAIEQRLSEVIYEIELMSSTLKSWQNQVDYSTVTLHVIEVVALSGASAGQRTYWGDIGAGFANTLSGMGRFFAALFKAFVIFLPVLAVFAAAVAAALLLARRRQRKKAGAASAPPAQGCAPAPPKGGEQKL